VIEIRSEKPGDADGVRRVNESAFAPRLNEARLVDMLREAGKTPLSLVAIDAGQIVGHVLFSPVSIAVVPEIFHGVGMGPVAVMPAYQGMGIGSQLIRQGLEDCQGAGYDAVIVLGHTGYYPRFGFRPASSFHLENEYNAGDAFMALELRKGALTKVSGLARFAPEFQAAGC
jgi:putative acetyltransferase